VKSNSKIHLSLVKPPTKVVKSGSPIKFVTFEGDMKVSIVSSGRFEVGQAGLYPPDPECCGSIVECVD
jgi:hypothetical protein